MSSSGKQKKSGSSSGMRILWIPGRKKHNYKGKYEPTNKGSSYGGSHGKKVEPWSLGGSKGQRDMINSDSDMPGTSDVPSVLNMLPHTVAIGGATASSSGGGDASGDQIKAAVESGKLEPVKEEEDREHGFPEGGSNTATLMMKDRKNGSCVSDDLDTIENLSETDGGKKSTNDLTDGILYPNMSSKRKNKKKKKNEKQDECGEEPNEKCVTCLYYTLACCECTIS
ncbi:cell wall integrity and stress response component 4 isoform X1 [Sergentomyia squamirostris]